MEVTAVLVNILAILSAVTSPDRHQCALDVCDDEATGGSPLDRSTSANVSNIVPDDMDMFRQSKQLDPSEPETGLATTSLEHADVAFRPVCCVQKWSKPRRTHRSKVEDTCKPSRCVLSLQADGAALCHRNTSDRETLDASLCEVLQGWEIASSLKPSHTHWCHDDDEGNEPDSSCITEDDPEMSRLATPVIFGCLVVFYIGHLTVLMMNLAEGGIDGQKRCSECAMNAGAKDFDMCRHQCVGDSSVADHDDANDYCNDSSCMCDPGYFEYNESNETDNNKRSSGANTEDFFDVTDDDYASVYYDYSVSNEIINADDEESVEEGSDDEKDTISDGVNDSYDTLNDECDNENCNDSSDKDTNSRQ
ncbi:hypothetical protein BsWGS_21300 [Bradybaena similaris]